MNTMSSILLCLVLLAGCAPRVPVPPADSSSSLYKAFTSLEQALAASRVATKPWNEDTYDPRRYAAIEAVENWPKVSADTEAKIGAVLVALLQDPDSNVRSGAACALGARGHAEAIPSLFQVLDKDAYPLAWFYGRYEDRRKDPPIELLRQGLKHPKAHARCVVLGMIGCCAVQELRADVARLLEEDSSAQVRVSAIGTLTGFKYKECVPALVKCTSSNDPELQGAAGYALTRLGDDDVLPSILPLLNSADASVRARVASGLGTMALKDSSKVVDALVAHRADESSVVREGVAGALGTVPLHDSGKAVDALAALLTDDSGRVRAAASRSLGMRGGWGTVNYERPPLGIRASHGVAVIKALAERGRTIAIAALRSDLFSKKHIGDRPEYARLVLIGLGDDDTIKDSLRHFREDSVIRRPRIVTILNRSSQPRLITELMEDVQREESAELRSYGPEFSGWPLSVEASQVICRVVQNIPDFDQAVKAWAEDLSPETRRERWRWRWKPAEFRDQVRRWWVQNKENIINAKYGAVKPPTD